MDRDLDRFVSRAQSQTHLSYAEVKKRGVKHTPATPNLWESTPTDTISAGVFFKPETSTVASKRMKYWVKENRPLRVHEACGQ